MSQMIQWLDGQFGLEIQIAPILLHFGIQAADLSCKKHMSKPKKIQA